MCRQRTLLAVMLLVCGSVFCHAATLDSGLFTTYDTDNAKTELNFVICGSIGTGIGCYDSGILSPFGKIGAIIEGNKSYNMSAGTVTRYLYVIDEEYGTAQSEVALYAYKRVDTITSTSDTVTFTLMKTVTLPLTGGSSTVLSVAANSKYLVIGSNVDAVPVEVSKMTYAITPLTIISQPVVSMTADNYGYITVTSASEFFVVGPDGTLREDGGGAPFTINTLIAVQP
jgi:hypothetical protein